MVSIIIPTFNRAQLLPIAVESALRAGDEIEIIVVDDASTDATPKVCRSFRAPVRVIRLQKNVGLGAARNVGINASTGSYLAFLDDDDTRLRDSLAPQVSCLEANPQAALCYGRAFIGKCETGEPTEELIPKEMPEGDLFWKLLRGNFIPVLSVLLRREPLLEAGMFDARLREVEDWDLWLRLSERWTFAALDRPVATYRIFAPNSGQLSSRRARMAVAAAAVQKRAMQRGRAKSDPARARECREKFLRETRYTLLHETIDALAADERSVARTNLLAVLQFFPASLRMQEFRELARLTFAQPERKQLKAIRQKLWANQPAA